MASLSQPLRSLKFCLGDEDVTATVLEAIKTSFPDKLAVRPPLPALQVSGWCPSVAQQGAPLRSAGQAAALQ